MNTQNYLAQQTTILERKAKRTRILGIISTLLILAYGIFGISQIWQFTDPELLSNFAINKFKDEAPKVVAATEMRLTEAAPEVANTVSKHIQNAIPLVRINAEIIIDEMVKKKFNEANIIIPQQLDAYFDANSSVFHPRGKNESVEQYAHRTANALADKFGQTLHETLYNANGSGLDDLNHSSDAVLRSLSVYIHNLANTDYNKLSHEDQITRMMIARIMSEYLKDVPLIRPN